MEQRAVTKVHTILDKSTSEAYWSVQQVYGDDYLSRAKRFLEGQERLKDHNHEGRPILARTPEMIEKVRGFVGNDRNVSLKIMKENLNISRETIRIILHEDLGKAKLCAEFIPHALTDK
ncbi:hypothetical protein Trydic_g8380 [Trypoxylus dichotomus]